MYLTDSTSTGTYVPMMTTYKLLPITVAAHVVYAACCRTVFQ